MNDRNFMNQKMFKMTVKELKAAIKIKEKESKPKTLNDEILNYPGRFESIRNIHGMTIVWGCFKEGNTSIVGEDLIIDNVDILDLPFNFTKLENQIYIISVRTMNDNRCVEIIRRK